MGNNAQKTPVARSLNVFAEKKANDAIQLLGKALPASVTAVQGSIVTVKFEVKSDFTIPNVTIPVATSQYMFVPLQPGDIGIVMPLDVRVGPIAGLGGSVADLSIPANLSSLIFIPIASKAWPAPTRKNKVEIWGPDGAIIRNKSKSLSIDIDETTNSIIFTGNVVMKNNLQLAGQIQSETGEIYAGDISTSGAIRTTATITGDTDVVAGGISGKTHTHDGVEPGPGNTGPPIPPTP